MKKNNKIEKIDLDEKFEIPQVFRGTKDVLRGKERFEKGEFFEDANVSLFSTDEAFQKTLLANGVLQSSFDRLTLEGHSFPFSEMDGLEVLSGGSSLVFTRKGEHYLLSTDGGNLAKYLYLFEWGKKKEQQAKE